MIIVLFMLLVVGLWSTTLWIGPAEDDLVSGLSMVQGEAEVKQEASISFRLNAEGVAVVQVPSSGFRADQKPILRLNSSVTDPTIDTIFLWQTFDGISGQELLTQPLSGSAVHDLSANPDWRGLIRTMGIQFSIVPDTGFKATAQDEIRINHFSLSESHWLNPLSTTVSAWLNMDSVTMRTPSHVGFAENGAFSPALVLGVFVLAVLLCWWFLPIQTLLMVFILSCFVLSLVELGGEMKSAPHYAKSAEYYALGIHNDTDKSLNDLAKEVNALLHKDAVAEQAKVMVLSTSDYSTKRLIYHLLPTNAGEVVAETQDDSLQPPLFVLKALNGKDSCEDMLTSAPFTDKYRLRLDNYGHCLVELM
ncbi:hypothetical protein [Marinicella sp. W31]|uniref:hypothetical protein n=1 Tax=Marinicella sp. W31 TaxID=3023713 RepID=UPI003756E9A9